MQASAFVPKEFKMTEAEEIVAFVKESIALEGRPITFEALNKVAPDAAKPHKFVPNDVTVSQVANVCFVPLSSLSELGIKATKRELFKSCEVVGILEPIEGVDFQIFDRFADGADSYTLTVVDKLQPGATPFVWYIGGVK